MSHRDITAHRYQTLRMEDVFYTVKMDFPQIEKRPCCAIIQYTLKPDILKAEKMNKIQRNIRHRARCSFFVCAAQRGALAIGARVPIRFDKFRQTPPAGTECFAFVGCLRCVCDARGT